MFILKEKWNNQQANSLDSFYGKNNAYEYFFERIGIMTANERNNKQIYIVDDDDNEIINSMNYWALVSYMNDDIREQLHIEMCPCSEIDFLKEYLKRDPEFIETIKQEFSEFLEVIE